MKPVLEAPRSKLTDRSMVVFERKAGVFSWNWHYHSELELTLIQHGEGTRLVGDHSESYRAGDLVLLGSNLPHTWFSIGQPGSAKSKQHQALVVQFRSGIFPQALLSLPEFESIRTLLEESARGLLFPERTSRKIAADLRALLREKEVKRWFKLAGILAELSLSTRTALASPAFHRGRSYKLSARLDRVISHIEKNFRQDISIVSVAKTAGLTPGAFSRFFRKMTHQTFVAYRNGRRIQEACRLLSDSDYSVTEIAFASGFSNLAHFNRVFLREKKIVPRAYRRLHNPS